MNENNTKFKHVGKRIKFIRIKLGNTMEEFGKRLKPVATKGTVSKWENGHYIPNNDRLRQIAELGNVTVEYLLSGNPFDNLTPEEQDEYIEAQIEAIEFDEYLKSEYPQLEDFLESNTNFYVNKYKLNKNDKKILYKVALALFGDKEPNYPSQEELEKEFSAHKDFLKQAEDIMNDDRWANKNE